jgi:hypothetical protein
MKSRLLCTVALACAAGASLWALPTDHDAGGGHGGGGGSRPAPAPRPSGGGQPHAPLTINMGHQSSGGHNRNYPSQYRGPARAASPSWGQVYRGPQGAPAAAKPQAPVARSLASGAPVAGPRPANAVHHHAYAEGYIRQKLQKLGVKSEPSYITDRAEMIHTDRQHSSIPMPTRGADNKPYSGKAISPRGADAGRLRDHMNTLGTDAWRGNVDKNNRQDAQAGRYYWHHEGGLDYCHYRDGSGYQWYGWYFGAQFFWTRNFEGRWWWYDGDFDRWAFYNDGFWWWQDPYHLGDLYCYSDGSYIPVNSQNDQVQVTQPDTVALQSFASPDNTRTVKLVSDSQDAFLYDTADPPSFEPIYLASGVQRVEFSDTANGRPLEIVLKLNDGSFDLFDGQGKPYNPGGEDADAPAPAADAAPAPNP